MNGLARARIQSKEPVATVQKDVQSAVVPPESRASQLPTACRQELTEFVSFAIKPPEFLAGNRVQCRNIVVGGSDVENAVDHERRGLEKTGRGVIFRQRRFPMFPLPDDFQSLDIGCVNISQRGVFCAGLIAPVVEPFNLSRRLCCHQYGTQNAQRGKAEVQPAMTQNGGLTIVHFDYSLYDQRAAFRESIV